VPKKDEVAGRVNSPDNLLMTQVRDGDLRKLAILFERYHKALYNFFVHMNGNRDLSEDLVQDVFFRILRYRHTYDGKHPFTAWMYQIARNTHVDHARKNKGELQMITDRGEEEDKTVREPVSPLPGAEESLRKRQEVRLLRRALDRLPEDKREVLVLSRFQNLKYDEIAQVLGCEVGAIKVRVYRATKALGEIYFQLAGEKAS
jgi:RNA polymerase sigma-70 factor, ECF subfamily